MKKKTCVHTLTIPIYDISIDITFSDNWQRHVKELYIVSGQSELCKEVSSTSGAVSIRGMWGNELRYKLFFCSHPPDRHVYHECAHILVFMLHDFALKPDIDNSEAIAYLTNYLIEEVIKLREKK